MAEAWDLGNYDASGGWETPDHHAIDDWGTVDAQTDTSTNRYNNFDVSKSNSKSHNPKKTNYNYTSDNWSTNDAVTDTQNGDWGSNLNDDWSITSSIKNNTKKKTNLTKKVFETDTDNNSETKNVLDLAFERKLKKPSTSRDNTYSKRGVNGSQGFNHNQGSFRGRGREGYNSYNTDSSRRGNYQRKERGSYVSSNEGYSTDSNYQRNYEGKSRGSSKSSVESYDSDQGNYRGRRGRGGYKSTTDGNQTETDPWGRKKRPNYDNNHRGFSRGRSNYKNTGAGNFRSDSDGGGRGARNFNSSQRSRDHSDKSRNFESRTKNGGYNQRDQYDRQEPTREFVPKMSAYKLKNILETAKDPDEIMWTLKAEKSGFPELLKDHSLTPEMVADILELLDEACQSTKKLNLLQLLGIINDSNFLFRHIPDYLAELRFSAYQKSERLGSTLQHLFNLLKILPELQPVNSIKVLTILLPQLSSCISNLMDQEIIMDYYLLDELEELESIQRKLTEEYKNKDMKKQADTEKQHATEPPDSFYNLHIFPTQEELNSIEKPYLRCNIAEGQYINVEHYLDTQFRLMREDFVRPLREGIREYQNVQKEHVTGYKPKKIQGLYIYDEVSILEPKCGLDGIHHVAHFNNRYLKDVQWQSSKRFFPGSLVCLSSDNFQTILFATVAKREPHLLIKGIVYIHFEEMNDKVKKITPTDKFVMIESSAFFEAYYHNLVCMQQLNEENFPLKDYIVYVKRDLKPPKYLSKDGRKFYDIRPLVCPYPEKRPPSKDFFNEDKISDDKDIYNFTPLMDYVSDIAILEEKSWPPHYDLGLDQFQLKALQLALTREFVMIQGPPGTGKTYIGLRIVQLLLFNSQFWRDEDEAPILIVCFTNHALDQFLEGVLHFTRSIIRVGGRCESEELQDYRISAKRLELKKTGKVPRHIRQNKSEIGKLLFSIQAKIDTAEKNISRAMQDILNDEDLEKVMGEQHFASLKSNNKDRSMENDGKLLLDWLQLRYRVDEEEDAMADTSSSNESDEGENQSELVPRMSYSAISQNNKKQENEDVKSDENENDGPKDVDDFFEDPSGLLDDQAYIEEEINEEIERMQKERESDTEKEKDEDPRSKWLRSKRRKTLQHKLKSKNKKIMGQSDVDSISNIWNIPISQRWKLYIYWVSKYVMQNYANIYDLHEKYEENIKLLKELRIEEDHFIIKGCKILGMTTTGAAKNQKLLAELKPKIVIVEEAAEVSESHIITALNQNTEHVILIGDHQQLRPSQASYSLAQEHNIDISLFERMVKNKVYFQQLVSQHRMRPCISKLLVPDIYKELRDDVSVSKYEPVKGVACNMYFVTHRFVEEQERDSVSRINVHEAKFVVKLAKYFVNQGYKSEQVTILTTYSAQVFTIKDLMDESLSKVAVKSVDNYQGEENEIIIISFVRSNAKEMVGFLKVHNRVCVALSRARKGLFAIGNFDMLASQSDLWKNIVTKLEDGRAIGSDLKLICQNHKDTFAEVQNPEDFEKVPEGGCSRPCSYRLSCGHTCPRRCHPYDPKHEFIQCKEICNKKTCKLNHRCPKKCFQCIEGCGDCIVMVPKELPCGHEFKIPCYKDPVEEKCRMNCGRLLSCSHICTKKCGEPCDTECVLKVTDISPCGHNVKIPCSMRKKRFELLRICSERCATELGCGHPCGGQCGKCRQGTLHQPCQQKCTRYLVCGHHCQEPCSKFCQPCKKKCENKCPHSSCPKTCGIPCTPCKMRCDWNCPHKRCKNLCSEPCVKCTHPCKKTLKCKHQCIGFCGEKCPTLCLICDKEKVTEIYFGMEDTEGARYVALEDCGCVYESVGLETWAKAQCEVDNVIRKLRCPKCQKLISNSHFLGKYVKTISARIESVKEKLFGMRKDIIRMHKALLIRVTTLYQKLEKQPSYYSFKDILTQIKKVADIDSIDIGTLTSMRNYLNFVDRMNSMDEDMWMVNDEILSNTKVYDTLLIDHLKYFQKNIASAMIESCKNRLPTQNQVEDIHRELNRLSLIGKIVVSVHNAGGLNRFIDNKQAEKHFKTGLAYMLTPKAIDDNLWGKVVILLTDMRRCLGLAQIAVTEEERKSIIAAVGLSQGHWYQCPNGHVYCIGECGGATQLSRCNECGAKIGGLNHTLQAGNQVATEMDGAKDSAWSEASNLQNFELEEY